MVMDSLAFDDLHPLLAEVGDERAWVFAEWVTSLPFLPAVRAVGLCMRRSAQTSEQSEPTQHAIVVP